VFGGISSVRTVCVHAPVARARREVAASIADLRVGDHVARGDRDAGLFWTIALVSMSHGSG
jgi:hypothetical protein